MKGKHPWGFTLIELLVAMAVTALIALMAWRFIDSAASATARSRTLMEPVEALEGFWQIIEQDLQHSLAAAPVAQPDSGPGSPPDFSGGMTLLARQADFGSGQPLLQLTRGAWANPLQQRRSDLQRVLYVLEDAALLRRAWPERNQPTDLRAAQPRILLEGVTSVSVRFFPLQGRDLARDWVDTWPLPQSAVPEGAAPARPLPLAVSVAVTLPWCGTIERWFMLPGA